MELDQVISRIKEKENLHSQKIQKEILTDLKEFKDVLNEEIQACKFKSSSSTGDINLDKLKYRIVHLKKNYKDLSDRNDQDLKELRNENENLRAILRELEVQHK